MLRTVKFWVRIIPRVGKRRTRVVRALYRWKKDATKAKRPGELLMQVSGFYWEPPRRNG
jgi:hypothetical protein